jgi:PhzF family phenazine biosynthesis protein
MMNYAIVDAFTEHLFGGNPAGVVLLDETGFPKESVMLQVAAELRYSETAFIKRHSEQEYTIRYFTPKAEVELCGHATIATFSFLFRKGLAKGTCLCHTLAGDLSIEVGEHVMMQMATPRIEARIDDTTEIYEALGIYDYKPSLPVMIAYSGLADLMIPVKDVDTLQALQPDMEKVSRLTEKHHAVSFHVFAFDNDGYTAHVRDFAPLYGVPEESATGTANAALTHYLQKIGCLGPQAKCSFLQGEAMGRPSVVATEVKADGTIYVGGTAAIVAEGMLNVNTIVEELQ